MTIEGRSESLFGLVTGRPKRFEPTSKYILNSEFNPYRVQYLEVVTDDKVKLVSMVLGLTDPVQMIFLEKAEINEARISRRISSISKYRFRWIPTA